MRGTLPFVLLVLAVATAVPSMAVTWDCVAQLNPNSNTEDDVWQYGYTDGSGGPFHQFCCKVDWNGWLSRPGLVDGWDPGGNSMAVGNGYPMWVRNVSGSEFDNNGNGAMYVDTLYCWPLGGPPAVRWKAPLSGVFHVYALWRAEQNGCKAGVRIYTSTGSVNWSSPFTANARQELTHNIYSVSLAQGDSIYFESNNGTDGSVYYDAVGFRATVYTLDGQSRIRGVVKNSAATPWPGVPIGDATVEIIAGGTGSTTTASDGSYSFDVAPGTYTLRFTKAGYATQDHSISVIADEIGFVDAEMSLTEGAVAGVVKNAAATPWPGTPVEGATVEVIAGGSGSTTTAANGGYVLRLAPGTYTIRISKDGYVPQQFQHTLTAGNTNWQNADLILADGAITGTVAHAATAYHPGYPIAGATVEVVGGSASTVTTVGGGYVLIAPPGTYKLRASKVGYQPAELTGVVSTAGATLSGQDFGLGFDVAVWDPLRDFSGQSNPNGVWAYGQGSGWGWTQLLLGAPWPANQPPGCPANTIYGWSPTEPGPQFGGGYPTIAYVKTGQSISVWGGAVVVPGDKVTMFPQLGVPACLQWRAPLDGTYTVNAAFTSLERGGTVAGVSVVSSTGEIDWSSPLSGVYVTATFPQADVSLSAGDYLYFALDDGGDGKLAGDNCGLAASIKLNLGADGMVGGRVRNSVNTPYPGQAIADATVEVIAGGSGSTTTDTDGTYYLRLAPGNYTIRVSKELYATQDIPVTITAGVATALDIDMEFTEGAVQGVVKQSIHSSNPGAPIAGATVEVVGGSASATTAADGTYSLILEPGTYTLKASAAGYLPQQIGDVGVTAGVIVAKNFELDADPAVWDVVRDFSGENNPNGVWAYGMLSSHNSTNFTLLPSKTDWNKTSGINPGDIDGWDRGSGGQGLAVANGYPCWIRNKRGVDFITAHGTYARVDAIFCYAWFDIPGAVQWTAPTAGSYTINATFIPAYSGGGCAQAGARVRSSSGSVNWGSVLYGPVPAVFPEQTADLSQGETVLFDVNDYGDGAAANDEQNLKATIRLNLGTDCLIAGVVRAGAHSPIEGSPIAGATVSVVGGSASTTTCSDGKYYLRVPGGTYTLRASLTNYVPVEATVNAPSGSGAYQDFALPAFGKRYDASADWSYTNNPNGTWTYGWYLGSPTGPFEAFVNRWGDRATPDSFANEHWTTDYNAWIGKYYGPTYDDQNQTATPPHYGWLQTGDVTLSGHGANWAVLRWTAPWAGTAKVHMASYGRNNWWLTGAEVDLNHNRTTSLGHIAFWGFDGSPHMGKDVRVGPDGHVVYDGTIEVAAGDTLDIASASYYGGVPFMVTYFTVEIGAMQVTTLSALRNASVGDPVSVEVPMVVTAASSSFRDGSFYIEDADRVSGIKVINGPAVALGDKVTLKGFIALDANGQKVIDATSMESRTSGDELAPLGMGNKAASGSDVTGLLVRVWGKVIEKAGDGSYAVLDDGAGVLIRIELRDLPAAIRDAILAKLSQNETVSVAGVAGLANNGTAVVPVVRPRAAGDIRSY